MKIKKMNAHGIKRTILAMTCFLLATGLTVAASDADTIDSAAQSNIDVDVLLALVAEVKSLRLELLEHRLETYEQRIAVLELGLEKVALERSEIDGKDAVLDDEIDEVEYLLQDSELESGERSYLEATREELDWKRSRTLDHETTRLDAEEDDLKTRHRALQKTRKQIAAHIQGLIENSNP